MKDLVEKFIVLQIQTAPSRLQPASARCFLAVMILPSAPSGILARMRNTHNCSEMHWNVAIPDYCSLVKQTSGMDMCQIGFDIYEFDSLRGVGIDIIGRVHFDNRDKFAIWMGSIGKATEPCQQTSVC